MVVVPDRADPRELEAAEELVRVVERATGARLEVRPEGSRGPGGELAAIHVGRTRRALAGGPPERDACPDGFLIDAGERELILLGCEPWSTRFAVATFLQETAGARWLFPGELGEIIPRASRLEAAPGRRVVRPDFAVRNFAYAQVWGPHARERHEEFRVWAWHNRVTAQDDSLNPWEGRLRHPTHIFFRLFPPEERAALPDSFFALVDGRRLRGSGDTNWQFCLTYPPLIEEMARRAREAFRNDAGLPIFSLSPNDLGNFCQCDRCAVLESADLGDRIGETVARAKDRVRGRDRRERDPRGDSRQSGAVFHFAGEVARRAPEVRFGCYAYASYRTPPRGLKLPPNVEVWWCQFAGNLPNAEERERMRSTLDAWQRAGVPLCIYEYYGHFRARTPRFFPKHIAVELRDLHARGIRVVHSEATADWALQGVNYWMAAQCLWDAAQDPDSLLDEYARIAAGAGAEGFRAYLRHQAEAWDGAAARRSMNAPAMLETAMSPFPRARLEALSADLASASAGARGADRERIEFFAEGLFYPRLLLEGVEAGERLRAGRERRSYFRAGDPPGSGDGGREVAAALPASLDPALLAAARALRDRETEFRRRIADGNALCASTLEITDRENRGGLGAENAEFWVWKYWPDYAEGAVPPEVDAGAFDRTRARIEALSRGRNLAGAAGARAAADSEFRSLFPPDRAVNGDPRDRGWRSAEAMRIYGRETGWADAPEHWLELSWPDPVALEAVVVHWGEEGAYWTPRRYSLEEWRDDRWQTILTASSSGECSASAHLFSARPVRKLRIRQAGDAGPPLRPNLMWIREVECYGAP